MTEPDGVGTPGTACPATHEADKDHYRSAPFTFGHTCYGTGGHTIHRCDCRFAWPRECDCVSCAVVVTPEPTEAGQRLLDHLALPWTRGMVGYEGMVEGIRPTILAIEAEATRAILDIAIEEAERLRSGMILAGDTHGEETLAEFAAYLRGLRS